MSYPQSKPFRQNPLWIALALSLLGHAGLFSLAHFFPNQAKESSRVLPSTTNEEVRQAPSVLLSPQELEQLHLLLKDREIPRLPEKNNKEQRRVVMTDPRLTQQVAPEKAPFESDQNSRAASRKAPIPKGKANMPTQEGRISSVELSLFDSRFSPEQEGMPLDATEPTEDSSGQPIEPQLPAMPKAMERHQSAQDLVDPTSQPILPSENGEIVPPQDSKERERMESMPRNPNDFSESPDKTQDPVEKANDVPTAKKESPTEPEEKAKPTNLTPSPESSKHTETNQGDAESKATKRRKRSQPLLSYESERSRTKVEGSISRDGESSVDAVGTPRGKFLLGMRKAIELEWQKQMYAKRDFIMPGSLRIYFQVDARSKVSNIRVIDEHAGSGVQKGFTLQSIRNAELPPMPSELIKDLAGEKLEITYTFNF